MKFNIDEYANLSSPIHHWEPHYKFISFIILVCAFASVQTLVLIPVILSIAIVFLISSGLPLRFLPDRLHYPGYFILGVVVFLPWISGETILWQWHFLALRQEGLSSAVLIIGRFLAIVTLSLIIFSTTPFLITVQTLRSLGIPPLLVDMLLLTYRYIFDLAITVQTMQRSMQLRGFNANTNDHSFRDRWSHIRQLSQQWAALTGTLLIRSYEQSDRIYQAMRLRGYGSPELGSHSGFWSTFFTAKRQLSDRLALLLIMGLAIGLISLNFYLK